MHHIGVGAHDRSDGDVLMPSPPLSICQAGALRDALEARDLEAHVYVGMRYWHPFTEEAIEQVRGRRRA